MENLKLNDPLSFKCTCCGHIGYKYLNGKTYFCPACGAKKEFGYQEDIQGPLEIANSALQRSDFKEAEQEYINIFEDFPNNAAAHFGYVLAHYKIRFVTDYNGKSIPTFWGSDIKSIKKDYHFEKAIENASAEMKQYYNEIANYIDYISKIYQEEVKNIKPYDIFICYKETDNDVRTKDSDLALELYSNLLKEGYKVFFARVTLNEIIGSKYEPYIYSAINNSKVMLVFSSKTKYIESNWMKNEWSRYYKLIEQKKKNDNSLIVIYKDIDPNSLPYELAARQALDYNSNMFYNTLFKKVKEIIKNHKDENQLVKIEKKKKEKKVKVKETKIKEKKVRNSDFKNPFLTIMSGLCLFVSFIFLILNFFLFKNDILQGFKITFYLNLFLFVIIFIICMAKNFEFFNRPYFYTYLTLEILTISISAIFGGVFKSNYLIDETYNITYRIENNSTVIYKIDLDASDVIIPDNLNNYDQVKIRAFAISGKKIENLTVNINAKLNDWAITRCNNLKTITFNNDVSFVKSGLGGVIRYCNNLEEVTFNNSIVKYNSTDIITNCQNLNYLNFINSEITTSFLTKKFTKNCGAFTCVFDNSKCNNQVSFKDENITLLAKGECSAIPKCRKLVLARDFVCQDDMQFNGTSIYIPKEVTYLSDNFFSSTFSKVYIYYEGSENEWNSIDMKISFLHNSVIYNKNYSIKYNQSNAAWN